MYITRKKFSILIRLLYYWKGVWDTVVFLQYQFMAFMQQHASPAMEWEFEKTFYDEKLRWQSMADYI